MQTYAYGFPRLGAHREFKKIIEKFWEKQITEEDLISGLHAIEQERINFYREYVDNFALGEFSFYDNILDTALILGVYKFNDFNKYYDYARGREALELRKYFNTNYHYLVPEIEKSVKFRLSWNKPLYYFKTFFSFKDNPVYLIGPYTFLKLSKLNLKFDKAFHDLCLVYRKLFDELKNNHVHSLHIEEPAFCLDVSQKEIKMIVKNYKKMIPDAMKVSLITYYESLDFLDSLYELPVQAFGLDFIAGKENINILKKNGFPDDKKIICGIVDARNPLRSNIEEKVKFLESIKRAAHLKEENVIISNSSPLFHLPVTIDAELALNRQVKENMSFAKERLFELKLIKDFCEGNCDEARSWSQRIKNSFSEKLEKELDTLSLPEKEFTKRRNIQKKLLTLPKFPVTTIGSFPQDADLRRTRNDFIKGKLSVHDYDNFIRQRIADVIEKQEEIGLDVLVSGEFERTDMVEFFAQRMSGFLTTQNGWVISYGTRMYRPPLIYDKIKREKPLTLKETFYAQSIAPNPVKGVLTGPVTMLAWSYNLRKEPLHSVSFELAKALNEEAKDLAQKGIKIIQIDEPAIKELAPLKKRKKDAYFSWAVRSFNIASRLTFDIQVHTHLCYSEFSGIIGWILKMNFDVITIEGAREKASIIEAFKGVKFNRAIGPGVWDVHAKFPADENTIRFILDKSIKMFGPEKIWINPDCGLKTRKWEEIELSLKLMVKIAKFYRNKFRKSTH